MKSIFAAAVAAAVLTLPAFGNECDADIQDVDAQFTSTNPLPMDTLKEAKRLRDEAYAHCESGQVPEGLSLLAQARQLLGI
ncbi:MAG: hypothetical protein WC809_17560 [Sinimarinibacterium sp.]|jgi:hypothetical protein